MSILNFRSKSSKDVDIVSDLDALIAKPVAFRFNGKVHAIKPISVVEFYKYANALAALNSLRDKKCTTEDLVEAYINIFSAVCDTITEKDVNNMTQAQAAALFQLTIDAVYGKAQIDIMQDEKKKSLLKIS